MKKITSILCALALTVSAFATPAIRRVAPVAQQPIQKAVAADYAFTSPANFVAINNEKKTGDYTITLFDQNGARIAKIEILTASNNSIAGVYTIGTDGGQQYNSILYAGANGYEVNYGRLSIVSRGTATDGSDVYDFIASGWELKDSEGESYAFSGTASGYAAWYTYYWNCVKNNTDCDKARITLSEVAKTTVAEVTCFDTNITIDQTKMTGENPYFSIDGAGFSSDNTTAYELYVILYGDKLEGSYTKDDVATYENNDLAAGLWKTTTPEVEDSWTEIAIASVEGTITRQAGDMYRIDLYATDVNNKVYHFTMYKGFSSNKTFIYDTDKDFHAAFALTEMTSLNEQGMMGIYNGAQYFIVEAKNATKYVEVVFYSNRIDDEITIPAGKYSVSANNVAGTLQAGEIITDEGQDYPNPSIACDIVNGNFENYYFITSGTAKVENANGNLYIEISGTNSFYRIVDVTIGVPPVTGIEQVKMDEVQDGQKMMIDGQLYIIRNGVIYNAQGAVVK